MTNCYALWKTEHTQYLNDKMTIHVERKQTQSGSWKSSGLVQGFSALSYKSEDHALNIRVSTCQTSQHPLSFPLRELVNKWMQGESPAHASVYFEWRSSPCVEG